MSTYVPGMPHTQQGTHVTPLAIISSGATLNGIDSIGQTSSERTESTITSSNNSTAHRTARPSSIPEDIYGIDNDGYEQDDQICEFPFPPAQRLRKASAPANLHEERLRRASRFNSNALTNSPVISSPKSNMHKYINTHFPAMRNPPLTPQSPESRVKTDASSVLSYMEAMSDSSIEVAKREFTTEILSTLGSIIYALLLVVLAGIFYLTDLTRKTSGKHQMFNTLLATIGMAWLAFFHWDLQKYKRMVINEMFQGGTIPPTALFDGDADRLSTNTEVICNNMGRCQLKKRSASMASFGTSFMAGSYRFLRGRNSGSFYLKCGMTAFCFGHIIHEGLRFGHQIYFFATGDLACQSITQIVLYTVRPIFSFYQLFMTFKYSNIVIHKFVCLAQFGLMHLIGTSLSFWLGTIIDDAVDNYYLHHTKAENDTMLSNATTFLSDIDYDSSDLSSSVIECIQSSSPSVQSHILPYMYPFTIEYNLLLAAIWYVVWHNISKDSNSAHPHPFTGKVYQDHDGTEDIHYESNLVIKADCHASNKGLFAGLSILLFSLVTMIIFFLAVGAALPFGMYVHHIQEYLLATLILLCTLVAYNHTSKFDISPYKVASHTMDFVLLLIPLPFYLLSNILSLIAEVNHANWTRVALLILITVQILVQTLFIVDAMHRCSQSRALRFQKPGREFITFLVILNITSWIVYTFETKAAEVYHNEPAFYGETVWMIVSHTTLPLMLFFRFHSSVCLADVWKFAYEKAHPD